jgi:phage terminase large subunit GpA-like protein
LDWEILAHSQKGATYSVNHGSIGTFKRQRERSKREQEDDYERERFTLTHNVPNSVWPHLEKIIRDTYFTESGSEMQISISLIDTGFGEKNAMQFIKSFEDKYVFGVKGRAEKNYRPIVKDTSPISRSSENPRYLYILEVNQLKDDLAEYMKCRLGFDESQPKGFMNFPQPEDGKYNLKSYFIDYEGERRTEELDSNGNVIGYKWAKKNTSVRNHFWDVRVYNIAAPLIYVDLIKRSDSKYKDLTWDTFVEMVVG